MDLLLIDLIVLGVVLLLVGIGLAVLISSAWRVKNLEKNFQHQYALIAKMQNTLRSKYATNAIAENAELVYQDLLNCVIPILASADIKPRVSTEHALWRALGGLVDEYGKNPYVLEQLRRGIKLDPNVARNMDSFIRRAEQLLANLESADPNGILTATFTDGLLGQALALFTQAKNLAREN